MTQDERWNKMWKAYMGYLERNRRRPSKYKPRDMKLVNWLKHNRKLVNKGTFPESRKEKFDILLAEAAKYQRKNQNVYVNGEEYKYE